MIRDQFTAEILKNKTVKVSVPRNFKEEKEHRYLKSNPQFRSNNPNNAGLSSIIWYRSQSNRLTASLGQFEPQKHKKLNRQIQVELHNTNPNPKLKKHTQINNRNNQKQEDSLSINTNRYSLSRRPPPPIHIPFMGRNV